MKLSPRQTEVLDCFRRLQTSDNATPDATVTLSEVRRVVGNKHIGSTVHALLALGALVLVEAEEHVGPYQYTRNLYRAK